MKKKEIPLHIQIFLGLLGGVIFGYLALKTLDTNEDSFTLAVFTLEYVKPIGDIFIRLLKMIAVPLVLASLIVGVSNLGDISKLSKMGGKTILIYICTTLIATTTGLVAVNMMKPGEKLPKEVRVMLESNYKDKATAKQEASVKARKKAPLDPLVEMVPQNIAKAMTDNGSMLQVVFFALVIGIAALKIKEEKRRPLVQFFESLNDVIISLVEMIMKIAPYGVFALISSVMVKLAQEGGGPDQALDTLWGLGWYCLTILLGLGFMVVAVYPMIMKAFCRCSYWDFFRGIRPAQMLAFSTSSSSATLPVTMDRMEKHLGVKEEVCSFVLPLGATVNMDGTSLYQSVAAVFIAQALGMDLDLGQQVTIVFTATLASIGSAGVPGAGLVMLIIVLEAIGVPASGIFLILAPDRILDMFRTTVNVTGDCAVTMCVAGNEGRDFEEFREEIDEI